MFASEYDTEGMTAKQKKNLRKKLYRKRKKMEQSTNNSKLDLTNQSIDEDDKSGKTEGEDAEEPDLDNINIEDVAIGGGLDKPTDKFEEVSDKGDKKKATTGSIDRDENIERLNELLNEDNDDSKEGSSQ